MKRNVPALLAILGSAALLVACSGGGNNLSDPPDDSTSQTCAAGLTCITGRLEDGQVAGLDYTCGPVSSVTNSSGDFVCPVGSVVQFSIRHSSSTSVVTLGDAIVPDTLKQSSLLPLGPNGLPLKRIYLTTLDLAGAASPDVPAAAAARSATRLLHALNTSTPSALSPKDNPARDIVLTPEIKLQFLEALGESVDVSSMTELNFETTVGAALADMLPPRALISVEEANGLLLKAKYGINAGAYLGTGGKIVSSIEPFSLTGFGIFVSFFYGFDASQELFGETTVVVDRKGRLLGAGSASIGSPRTDKVIVPYDPKQFYVRTGNKIGLDGSIAGMTYDVDDGQVIKMKTGVIDRNFMAINRETYQRAYGDDLPLEVVDTRIGTLENENPALAYTSSGVLLQRPTNLVSTLDPEVWSAVTFPLHLTATLIEEDDGPDVGSISFSILSDGNIVTDLDEDCASVDLDSLSDGDVQEVPVGVVARAIQIESRKYMEPLLILPKTTAFGTSIAGAFVGGLLPVRLRVDAGAGAAFLKIYSNPFGEPDDEAAGPALWKSEYRSHQWLRETLLEGSSDVIISGYFETGPAACAP